MASGAGAPSRLSDGLNGSSSTTINQTGRLRRPLKAPNRHARCPAQGAAQFRPPGTGVGTCGSRSGRARDWCSGKDRRAGSSAGCRLRCRWCQPVAEPMPSLRWQQAECCRTRYRTRTSRSLWHARRPRRRRSRSLSRAQRHERGVAVLLPAHRPVLARSRSSLQIASPCPFPSPGITPQVCGASG